MATYNARGTHRVVDAEGNKTAFTTYYSDLNSASLATDILAPESLTTALDAVMDAKIYATEITLFIPNGTVKSVPVSGSRLNRGGLLDFDVNLVVPHWALFVPGVAESLVSGNEIVWPDSLYTALNFLLTNTGSPPWLSNNHYDAMNNIAGNGRLAFHKMRNVLSRNR